MGAVTYLIVGLYYNRGEHKPAKGSFLYLLFYVCHVFLLEFMATQSFSLVSVVMAITIFFSLHIGIIKVKNTIFRSS